MAHANRNQTPLDKTTRVSSIFTVGSAKTAGPILLVTVCPFSYYGKEKLTTKDKPMAFKGFVQGDKISEKAHYKHN